MTKMTKTRFAPNRKLTYTDCLTGKQITVTYSKLLKMSVVSLKQVYNTWEPDTDTDYLALENAMNKKVGR